MKKSEARTGLPYAAGDAIFAFLVSSCFAAVIALGPVGAFSYLFRVSQATMAVSMIVTFVAVASLLTCGLMGVRKSS